MSRANAIQSLVIDHLRGLPIETELPTAALLEAIEHPDLDRLDYYLSEGLEAGSIECRNAGGLKFWSLSPRCWWGVSRPATETQAAPPAPAPARRAKPLTKVKLDPLAAAIAGRGYPDTPEVLKLKTPAPPPAAKKTRGKAKEPSPAKAKTSTPKAAMPTKAPAAPSAPQGPKKPRKSTALRNLQQRDDFPKLEMGTEPCPSNIVRHNTQYARFFSGVKVDGPPVKCSTDDFERVRVALRSYLNKTLGVGKYQIRSLKDYPAPKTSRLWVQSKESQQ